MLGKLMPMTRRRALTSLSLANHEAPAVASSAAMRWAVGGWCFFIAENTFLSENRGLIISKLGDVGYHNLYGALSTAACASIALGYQRIRGAAPLQWPAGTSPPGRRLAACFLLQAIGLAGLSQSLPKLQLPWKPVTPSDPPANERVPQTAWAAQCPFDFAQREEGLHGIQRVSRHAGLWSFAACCLGAATVVPSLPQALCLAMPTLVALVGGAHTDSRHRRGMGGELDAELDAASSNIPCLALLSGAQGDVSEAMRALACEGKAINAALSLAVAASLLLRHIR